MKKLSLILTLLVSIATQGQKYSSYQILEKQDYFYTTLQEQKEKVIVTYIPEQFVLTVESNTLSYHFIINKKEVNTFVAIDGEMGELVYDIIYTKRLVVVYFVDFEAKQYCIIIKK